ncbi:hypothetical protein HU200_018320 [Digitaria exilis]|uniref:Ubiquitin carboxyl-terminal hydrolase 7 ICP0-binding domain-containing protein n=1 Tax=Digitaria exilis TaxID=1010633 RepID=A0A835F5P7_9POAL|nr:hypothetical protein HU200_018320 [Digitaria exilis]
MAPRLQAIKNIAYLVFSLRFISFLGVLQVVREEDMLSQIGKDGHYFDLVDFSRVRTFRIPVTTTLLSFKEKLAEEFGTQDHCPLPSPHPPTKEDFLLFLKLYDPEQMQLRCVFISVRSLFFFFNSFSLDFVLLNEANRYVGMLFVKASSRPLDILPFLRSLAGFPAHEEIELYEEIQFKPFVWCETIDIHMTFKDSQIDLNGDIICYQKRPKPQDKYPYVRVFFQHVFDEKV